MRENLPSPEERKHIQKEFLTEQQAEDTRMREDAFEHSTISRLDPKLYTLRYTIDARLLHFSKIEQYAQKQGFEGKKEFHITIMTIKIGKTIHDVLKKMPPDQKTQKLDALSTLIHETDWVVRNADPTIFHIQKEYVTVDAQGNTVQKEIRESLIQRIHLPTIKEFYQRLNALLGTSFDPPPPHITLYTKGTHPSSKAGIGIDNERDLTALNPQPIELTAKE